MTNNGVHAVVRLPMLSDFLREQDQLSAVERFAAKSDADLVPKQQRYYRERLPAGAPGPGQQYAFSVDLDACTGCKACVTACHNLNGLDGTEAWRSVGKMVGGTTADPMQRTITTSCHHCVEPACSIGCPANAYEKDPTTGAVVHLDDQCIGCQYCTLTCPYDAPQYNASMGIVRKCDMCHERLGVGEAPACVAACPSGAISIDVVSVADAIENAQAESFLPGVPSPGLTVPTTSYKTAHPLPRNFVPEAFHVVAVGAPHDPLVAMLVGGQLGLGMMIADAIYGGLSSVWAESSSRLAFVCAATIVIGLSVLSSVLHLGRPHLAFRALLGLRHSWLSREALGFGLFAGTAVAHAAATMWLPTAKPYVQAATLATGACGFVCSIMVYQVTGRQWWRGSSTTFRFASTTLLLGSGALWLALVLLADPRWQSARLLVSGCVVVVGSVALIWEASVFGQRRGRQYTARQRAAQLMRGPLRRLTVLRFAAGSLGILAVAGIHGIGVETGAAVAIAAFAALVVGEVCERRLFFLAESSPRMPGVVGS